MDGLDGDTYVVVMGTKPPESHRLTTSISSSFYSSSLSPSFLFSSVAQSGLHLLHLGDFPVSASQVAGLRVMSYLVDMVVSLGM